MTFINSYIVCEWHCTGISWPCDRGTPRQAHQQQAQQGLRPTVQASHCASTPARPCAAGVAAAEEMPRRQQDTWRPLTSAVRSGSLLRGSPAGPGPRGPCPSTLLLRERTLRPRDQRRQRSSSVNRTLRYLLTLNILSSKYFRRLKLSGTLQTPWSRGSIKIRELCSPFLIVVVSKSVTSCHCLKVCQGMLSKP